MTVSGALPTETATSRDGNQSRALASGDGRDYCHVEAAIRYLSANWRDQPDLAALARHVGLSPHHLQRLFTGWAGLSPKEFVKALTLDHARAMLRGSASVLDTAYDAGLSGPGRLHDLFVAHEAMTPGDYKAGGRGLSMTYGFHDSPFGRAVLVVTARGLAGIGFADPGEAGEQAALGDMMKRWPNATYVRDPGVTAPYAARAFDRGRWRSGSPLKLVLIGSGFDVSVWETLLRIPAGQAVTYGDIAAHLGKPKAARAVGSAVGRNPISFVVPCHRVLCKSGALGGYHWGLARKQAIIGWEAGLSGRS